MTVAGNRLHPSRLVAILVLLTGFASPIAAADALPKGFVRLASLDTGIREVMRYATAANVTGKPLPGYGAAACILRDDVARALARVQTALRPEGLGLVVFDCYRPQRAVAALVAWTQDKAVPQRGPFHPAIDRQALVAQGYIAARSLHASGFAVDLALAPLEGPPVPISRADGDPAPCTADQAARGDGDLLDFGTTFDCFDPAAATQAPGRSEEVTANRQRLVAAMAAEGFVNYRREWWHFTYARRSKAVAHDFPITDP